MMREGVGLENGVCWTWLVFLPYMWCEELCCGCWYGDSIVIMCS